jgi:secreted trypsin-like serine protease
MTKLRRVTVALSFALAVLASPYSASAGDAPHNWMREYVELRKQAMLERVLGPEASAMLAGSPQPRIVGGRPASANVHPFQVSLLFKFVGNDYFAHYCGGVLIRPKVVVTAAHCSDFVSADQVQVLTGTHVLDGSGMRRNIEKIVIHPDWNPTTFDSDVAVWLLRSEARDIPLPTLVSPYDEPEVGTATLVTGWGATSEAGAFPRRLRQVRVPILSRRNCNDRDSYRGQITEAMFCAGTFAGGRDSCQGDSGGPLTTRRNGRFTVLTGIVSWGTGCARPDLPGVYTRLTKFRGWILWTAAEII